MLELRSDRLRLFDAVVRHGGFSAAARALDVTQSSVSQSLAALEADIGQPLFDRTSRKLRLTEAGLVLHAHARGVLDSLEQASSALQRLEVVVTGRLALGATDTLATHLLPPVFAAFRKEHPGVELHLDNRTSPAIAEKVAARELDLGVVSLPLPRGSTSVEALTQVPLTAQRDVVIVPRGHELASKKSAKLSDVAKYPLVLLDGTTASRAWLERHFGLAKLRPRIAMEMSSIEVLKRLVELDFGISVVPELAVADEVRAKRLVAIPLAGAERRMVGLLLPKVPTRAASAFAELAKRLVAK
jgi:DNA-binding transcriptional LysR family regulator